MYMVVASSLREAFQRYLLAEHYESRLLEDGSIAIPDWHGGETVYSHPLEAFESECKSLDGQHGNLWDVREYIESRWSIDFGEVFCSENPFDVKFYIDEAREQFQLDHPGIRASAFIWRLEKGVLVTFHRRRNRRRRWPIEIVARYLFSRLPEMSVIDSTLSLDEIVNGIIVSFPA
jgi:hypothetical protein